MVLLSTHNIIFWLRIKKKKINYALLSTGLLADTRHMFFFLFMNYEYFYLQGKQPQYGALYGRECKVIQETGIVL